MERTEEKLKRIKVDAIYGKKKHFNVADRIQKYHYWIGIPLVLLNVIVGSVLLYILTDGTGNGLEYLPIALAFIASILGALQTYLNLPKKVEGHRRVGNQYLSVMKKCDRIQGYIKDKIIENDQLINKIEEVAIEIDNVNKGAESYPTNQSDYKLAKKGIEDGEENYTENELSL